MTTDKDKLMEYFKQRFADQPPLTQETRNSGHAMDDYLEALKSSSDEKFKARREAIAREHKLSL